MAITSTHTEAKLSFLLQDADSNPLPKALPPHITSNLQKLSKEQAGHLRHFYNLASQVDGEWRHMGTQDPGQEWLDAYRYQLATATYAAGAAHFHRLPALRSVFKDLMTKLIHKMLRRETWGYWYLTSQSGIILDPSLSELRRPWADPNKKENIMYSGHLLLMVSLYSMLFNDDSFDEAGALTFIFDPVFWGMGPEKFEYSRSSLQKCILDEMEREKWLGVCCEPNNIFIVCNQFPIIALRYNDIRNGTTLVDDVLTKYKAAWKEKGMTDDSGRFLEMYRVKQGVRIPGSSICFTAWASAFMNAWNSDVIHSSYKDVSKGFISHLSPTEAVVNPPKLAHAIRQISSEDGVDADSPETIAKAKELAPTLDVFTFNVFTRPTWGYVLQWVSEIGDTDTLNALLNHVDANMKPTWENGGLYYPRTRGSVDAMDPYTGNAAVGYARLNVPDGQKKMWEGAWTKELLDRRPYVDGIEIGQGVDWSRGEWLEESAAMVLMGATWDGSKQAVRPVVKNLRPGKYGLYLQGELVKEEEVRAGGSVAIEIEIGGEEVEIVLVRA